MLSDSDINFMIQVLAYKAPQIEPYARFLTEWKEIVNSNTDGWNSWLPASRAAEKLQHLLLDTQSALRTDKPLPSLMEFNNSIRPIISLAKLEILPVPELRECRELQAVAVGY